MSCILAGDPGKKLIGDRRAGARPRRVRHRRGGDRRAGPLFAV